MHLRNFFIHALNKATQLVVGKFPTKVNQNFHDHI
jgi:hypothetical protein